MLKKVFSIMMIVVLTVVTSLAAEPTIYFSEKTPLGDIMTDENVVYIVEVSGGGMLEKMKTVGKTRITETVKQEMLESAESAAVAVGEMAAVITGNEIEARISHIMNAFIIEGKAAVYDELKAIDGVETVYVSKMRYKALEAASENDGMGMAPVSDETVKNNCELREALIGHSGETATYRGAGKVIGIIDTELNTAHSAFSQMPDVEKLTKSDIEAIWNSRALSANALADTSVSAEDVYKSAKIPFAFDYYGKDAETKYDSSTDGHGSHVSGIAAGNAESGSFYGTASDAQIVFMKASPDGKENGKFPDAAVLRALDDLVKLEVDVINLSFGAPGGFSEIPGSSESVDFEKIYTLIEQSGIVVAAAAGNAGSIKTVNNTYIKTADIDYGTVNFPGSYRTITAVASSTTSRNTNEGYETDGEVASTSSWGVTPELTLKPEITTVGESVYSALSNGSYGLKNGTSMAAPQYSGAVASVMGYLEEKYPNVKSSVRAEQLLAATATVLTDEGMPISPRKQGAGRINIDNAVSSPAVIYAESGTVKLELGEIARNTETVNVSFKALNQSTEAVTYTLSGDVMTDGYITLGSGENVVKDTAYLGASYVEEKIVTLQPNAETDINAVLRIDKAAAEQNMEIFTNGFYIDGFIRLVCEGEPELSIPYMGFYGDWDSIPIFNEDIEERSGLPTGLYGAIGDGVYRLNTIDDVVYYSPDEGGALAFLINNRRSVYNIKLDVRKKGAQNPIAKGDIKYIEKNLTENAYLFVRPDLSGHPDGEYVFTVLIYFRENSEPQSIVYNVLIDRVFPVYSGAELIGNTLRVRGSDNCGRMGASMIGKNDEPKIVGQLDRETGDVVFDVGGVPINRYAVYIFDPAQNAVMYDIEAANGYAASYTGEMLKRAQAFPAFMIDGKVINKSAVDKTNLTDTETEKVTIYVWDSNMVPILDAVEY